jgi:4,5-dihydroxyphthalate decarboxylase
VTTTLDLTLAVSRYDHVRDLVAGEVPTPGMSVTFLELGIPEIFGRFTAHREWQVSELGLGKFTSLVSQGDDSLIGIPVFPSRLFRQSAVYVRADSALTSLDQLAGLRVGIPEWAQTACIYARGALQHAYGVDLASVHWVQAGVNQAGRTEKVALDLPAGITVEPAPEDTLDGMLLEGRLDAVISAQPPESVVARTGRTRRLLADPRAVEEQYWRETGIFPIMHTVVIRRDVYDAHPWVAGNLLAAFEEAKRRSLQRLTESSSTRVAVPWINDAAEKAREIFGEDPWPYGLTRNRTTLEAFLGFAHEQGVLHRPVAPEELFAPTALETVRA